MGDVIKLGDAIQTMGLSDRQPSTPRTHEACYKCKGTGIRGALVQGDRIVGNPLQATACDCDQRRKGLHILAAFPLYLGGKSLGDYDWSVRPKCHSVIGSYVANLADNIMHGRGVSLIGSVGTGKTHLAAALGGLACDAGLTVAFWNVPAMLQTIRESYDQRSGYERGLLERLGWVQLLILDDLAAEKSTDWAADTIYRIVNSRYENLRAMMVTANVSMEALRDRVGERVVSRLWERSVVVDLSGPDYRQKLRAR